MNKTKLPSILTCIRCLWDLIPTKLGLIPIPVREWAMEHDKVLCFIGFPKFILTILNHHPEEYPI